MDLSPIKDIAVNALTDLKISIEWLKQNNLLDDAKTLTTTAAGKIYRFIKEKLFAKNPKARETLQKLETDPQSKDFDHKLLTYLEDALEDNQKLRGELVELMKELDETRRKESIKVEQTDSITQIGDDNIAVKNSNNVHIAR